ASRQRRRGRTGVAGVILDASNRVLLLEHVFWPRLRWGLPGGWAKEGEVPREALEREIREELGLNATAGEELARSERDEHLSVVFLCDVAQTRPSRLAFEIADARLFSREEMPADLLDLHREAIEAARNRSCEPMV
ncbi:MAG TPA: NUDIX hydrolase, partial [Thermoanaerobaculia bacterium]|nr:NUDIX hydrolase [Thermoanaerobaculia bacterium]